MRAIRRANAEKMKRRAAKFLIRWSRRRNPLLKSSIPVDTYYTATEMRAKIGRLAAMHCTHICKMCKYEKHHDIKKSKSTVSVRILDLT